MTANDTDGGAGPRARQRAPYRRRPRPTTTRPGPGGPACRGGDLTTGAFSVLVDDARTVVASHITFFEHRTPPVGHVDADEAMRDLFHTIDTSLHAVERCTRDLAACDTLAALVERVDERFARVEEVFPEPPTDCPPSVSVTA